MSRYRLRGLCVLVAGLLLAGGVAYAAFPEDPPNDPLYPPDECPPGSGIACPYASGQWNLFSRVIAPATHPSGISADLAWKVTTGHPEVIAAVLDSGVNYDHEDLRDKIWLNRGELPPPQGACSGSEPYDCNGDGIFNVEDYAGDPRVAVVNGTSDVERGDLRVFANGSDDDGNGYVDDLSGWDSDDDDGDEFDHRFFGHGTGRAGILAPDTNNGIGVAGVCPDCPLMNVRIDDTFVHSSEGLAKGAIYAIDNGARVITMALGGVSASRLSRDVFEYGTAKNVLSINASANEFSTHHNFQSIFDDVMSIGGVTAYPKAPPLPTETYMQKANFANYGAHTDVVAPTIVPAAAMGGSKDEPVVNSYSESAGGTSSSTPHAAGVAALVFSRAREMIAAGDLDPAGLALQDISAQEVRQIINRTADDIVVGPMTTYPARAGWDKWTGYGRVNAKKAVDRVAQTTIPPEADINSPDWYSLVDGVIRVGFYANARWADEYEYKLEVAPGVEPTSFTTIKGQSGVPSDKSLSSADLVDNYTATWDTRDLPNGIYTLRLQVTDDKGNRGEDRMAIWVRHDDPQDQPGFPLQFDGSLESLSVALVDLNANNNLEIVFTDGNGFIHARRPNGKRLRGFPVHTDLVRRLPLRTSDAFDGDLSNGEIRRSYASTVGGPAVADIDRDGLQEIVTTAFDGKVYCWKASGERCKGFPAATDNGFSRDQYGPNEQVENNHPEAIAATPALGDLDGDGKLEIIAGSLDQKLYVWRSNGTRMAPFPKVLFDPASSKGADPIAPRAIIATAAIADVDNDKANEIVVGTNETYPSPNYKGVGGSGRVYLIEPDGTIPEGWPVKPTSISPSAVPLVAEGAGTSPIVADLNGDGTREIAAATFFGDPTIYRADGSEVRTLPGIFGTTGPGGDIDETTSEGKPARSADQPSHFYVAQSAFADLEGDRRLEYITGSVGNGIVAFATNAGQQVVFDHLISAWDATTGEPKPNFPRVMEDWQFFNGPAVQDISGDGRPEIIQSSGGFFVHAFSAAGSEPPGWPKLTGHWQVATPSIGDIDGDGDVEVVQTTRLGTVFVWSTSGSACQTDQWRKFHHDEWNTGTYGTDTRRPARITDLAIRGGKKLTLTWSAPGDDGLCGQAARYELRASRRPITPSNFAAARRVRIGLEPGESGAEQSVSFRRPHRSVYFALRAVDEAGNGGVPAVVGICGGHAGISAVHRRGTARSDVLTGTRGRDVICGLGGADVLKGRGGADILIGGRGGDRLFGSAGHDRLIGGRGRDRLFGSAGRDRLFGSTGHDRLFGSTGHDRLFGNAGRDRVFGGAGNDFLNGGRGADRCRGGRGRDRLRSC